MFGSEVLDVALGLIFIYLVLSLICSAACEAIEAVLKSRSAYLKRGLQELLSDPSGKELVAEVYSHPLVCSLFTGQYNPSKDGNLPSYIPPANFALALMDIVGVAKAVKGAAGSPEAETIRNTLEAYAAKNPAVSQALLTLAHTTEFDLNRMRSAIEGWYNSSMDRVSGWFKRRTHWVVLALGLIIAVGINADTILITNSLATDKSLRESLVLAASEDAKRTDAIASQNFQNDMQTIREAGLPLGWTTSASSSHRVPQTWREWLVKMLGLILTTFAISLGGPFWFDLLNQFMVVRSTIKPQEKSPVEPSKS
ncbi:MAG TPA: hypothetical protein VGM43_09125 [Bryobacteraceae bacterium]|jgi:hypothetical protein